MARESEEVTSDPMCKPRHMRAAGLCARGSREWCKHNGISWNAFLTEGIPASVLEATRDPIVAKLAAAAREEAKRGN